MQVFLFIAARYMFQRTLFSYLFDDITKNQQDITDFVTSIKPVALHAMWSKIGFLDAGMTLQILATLRPELILPALGKRASAAIHSLGQ
jgi:hypothetical protein